MILTRLKTDLGDANYKNWHEKSIDVPILHQIFFNLYFTGMSDTILGFNKSNVVLAAGIAGAAFLGYCIYFDHKRINAPDYKDKIRQSQCFNNIFPSDFYLKTTYFLSERRAQAGAGGMAPRRPAAAGNDAAPDVTDPSQMQRFFLQEVQLGEELMAAGNVDEGAVHIANAVMLCGESQQLLSIFQQTLSEDQFRAVVQQLPSTREVSGF